MTAGIMSPRVAGWAPIARRGLPLLAIGLLVDAAFIFVFLVALQSYLPESLHESEAIAGYALAAFGLAKLISQVAGGMVSDRLGVRRALIIGTLLLVLGDVSILLFAHVAAWAIIAVAAVDGVGSSITWPAVYSAGAARFDENEKGRFTALLTLATGGALLVGLGGGAFLNAAATFNVAMAAPIAAVGAACLVATFARVPAREEVTDDSQKEVLPALRRLRDVVRSPQRLGFATLVLTEGAALGALAAMFRAYGRDVLHVSLTHEAILLAPAAVLGAGCVTLGGSITDRAGGRWVLAPGFAIAGGAVLLLSNWTHPVFVVFIAALGGAGFGAAVPSISATMMALAGPASTRGGVIGWFMMSDGIGHAAGPAVAGVLLAMFGASGVMLFASALFFLAALIATSVTSPHEARARELAQGRRSYGGLEHL